MNSRNDDLTSSDKPGGKTMDAFMESGIPAQRQSDGTAEREPEFKETAERRLPCAPCWLLFILFGLGLADTLQGIEVGANHVSRVSGGIADVLNSNGAESLGRGGKLLPAEVIPNLGEQSVILTDALEVSLPHVLGLPVIGALNLGSPHTDKGGEVTPPSLNLPLGGADGRDDRTSSTAAKKRADKSYGLWLDCLLGALGGVCGSFLVMLIRGDFSNQRQSDGTAAPDTETGKGVNGGCHARVVR